MDTLHTCFVFLVEKLRKSTAYSPIFYVSVQPCWIVQKHSDLQITVSKNLSDVDDCHLIRLIIQCFILNFLKKIDIVNIVN